ncbi:uncharacterized protein LOC105387907 [Plutella xylostella]|uniref:uncharacterized protein LOC105387907 n=1 Tax=Plutella xylostella TaxID=51655 RepID=UPI0005D0B072|nr:uncharacterized protein LOC105387907 [Plutella xylostella]
MAERKKRKFEGEEANDIAIMMKDMFSKLSKEQNQRFHDLQSCINNLSEENSELVKSIELMNHKYDEFLSRITRLESERKTDKVIISQLEDRIETMERKARASGIEIRNIPKTSGETKNELCAIVKSLGKTLNVDIHDHDIRDIYRIKSKDSTNPIITEFSSVLKKEKILKASKDFNKNKSKGDKLNTSHFQIKTPVKPVFLSETLTYKAQRLFYLARDLQRNYNFAFCWTSHGVVYLRRDENSPQIRVTNETDLEGLRKE